MLISNKKTRVIFHYNKAHNENQDIPQWIVKCKGETYYVNHLDSEVGFSTKETPTNSHTKGSLMFKGRLKLVEESGTKTALVY